MGTQGTCALYIYKVMKNELPVFQMFFLLCRKGICITAKTSFFEFQNVIVSSVGNWNLFKTSGVFFNTLKTVVIAHLKNMSQ